MKNSITKLSRVVEEFGQQIVEGTYAPGSPLPSETELCKTFELSRATLREVVKVLAAKRLIKVQQHSGLQAMPKEKWNYLDVDVLRWALSGPDNPELVRLLLETRSVVEPAITEWAAERATACDLMEMESAVNDMAKYRDDKPAFNSADVRFHQALVAAAHNYVIEQLGEAIGILQRAVFDATYVSDASTRDETIAQHRELYDAIRLKQAKSARRLSEAMIKRVEKRIVAAFEA